MLFCDGLPQPRSIHGFISITHDVVESNRNGTEWLREDRDLHLDREVGYAVQYKASTVRNYALKCATPLVTPLAVCIDRVLGPRENDGAVDFSCVLFSRCHRRGTEVVPVACRSTIGR
jgi:hypothetical protein